MVTDHAEQRVKDRLGLSKTIANKVANKALEKGIQHKDVSGSLRRFLDGLYLQYCTANGIRIYNNKVFLFHGNVLITILDLPHKYFKTVEKIKSNILKNTED
jgi:predicted HAD superfamily Cof-like phosphohydrolase